MVVPSARTRVKLNSRRADVCSATSRQTGELAAASTRSRIYARHASRSGLSNAGWSPSLPALTLSIKSSRSVPSRSSRSNTACTITPVAIAPASARLTPPAPLPPAPLPPALLPPPLAAKRRTDRFHQCSGSWANCISCVAERRVLPADTRTRSGGSDRSPTPSTTGASGAATPSHNDVVAWYVVPSAL